MIQRKHLDIILGDKAQWKLTVWEANWDMASTPLRIEADARKARENANGSANHLLLSFHELIYPWLFSYSTGSVPGVEEALELSDTDLDLWAETVRDTNPDLFPDGIPQPVVLEFRDGSSLTVKSSKLASSLRKLFILDRQANQFLLDNPTAVQEFSRMKVYAKMACCSVGDVPSYFEIGEWPAVELQRWYEVVLRLNPHLFLTPEEELERDEADHQTGQAKKKSAQER